jgi:hypothetical protein
LLLEVARIHAAEQPSLSDETDEPEEGGFEAALTSVIDTDVREENRDLQLARSIAREIEELQTGESGSTMSQEERVAAMSDRLEGLNEIEGRIEDRAAKRLGVVHGV